MASTTEGSSASASAPPMTMTTDGDNSNNNGRSVRMKTIYLIRHAESEENRKLGHLKKVVHDVKSFNVPSGTDLYRGMSWLNFVGEDQLNSDVSDVGRQQIDNMSRLLRDKRFIDVNEIQLVAHSPLKRARETSRGLLGCCVDSNTNNDNKVDDVDNDEVRKRSESSGIVNRVVELDLLLEKTPAEYSPMYSKRFRRRLDDLEHWLNKQHETNIVLVGHSQHFKALLNLTYKFDNCDVWKVTFDGQRTTSSTGGQYEEDQLPIKWSNLEKLYSGKLPSNQEEDKSSTSPNVGGSEKDDTKTSG